MANLNFEQILNRTESLNVSKTYNYIKQQSINGKPSVISGNEELKTYPLKIKLHHSFCNPQKVINEAEQKAKNREIINYFQNGRYIGDYVINKYKIDIKQKIDDVIIYAELNIDLLEYPQETETFRQQTNIIPTIFAQIFSQNSISVKTLIDNTKRQIIFNIFDSLIAKLESRTLNSLSTTTNTLLHKLETAAINDIERDGLSNSAAILNKYTENLNLEDGEKSVVISELNKIPNQLTNAALRNV